MKKSLPDSNTTKLVLSILFIFLITVILFNYSLNLRKPWQESINEGGHQWLTGSTIKFVNNWLKEGAFNLKFALLENPKSIEFNDIQSREPYPSYPPGAILPVYILAKISNAPEITDSMIMTYNTINHFLLALITAMFLLFFYRFLKKSYLYSIFAALISVIVMIFSPATLYFFQNVYFSDQAIVLPFLIFVILEMLQVMEYGHKSKLIPIFQALVMFYGVLTDWLFFFLILVIWLIRMIRGELGKNHIQIIKKSATYFLPAIIALILFVWQLLELGILFHLKYKFMVRTGLDSTNGINLNHFFNQVWQHTFINSFGKIAFYFFWASLAMILFSYIAIMIDKKLTKYPQIKYPILLITFILLPCLLQMLFFKNHTMIHHFSVLKLSIFLSISPVLIPNLIYTIFKRSHSCDDDHQDTATFWSRYLTNPLVIFLILSSIMLIQPAEFYLRLFPVKNNKIKELGSFINDNTDYEDIVFSFDFEIPANPPVLLAYSNKRVYKISDLDDINEKITNLTPPCLVNLLFPNHSKEQISLIKKNFPSAKHIKNESYHLIKINLENFKSHRSMPVKNI